ncbi:hypothetical protein PV325_008611 [Microctonus aethiopoides]|nr:hypothetical protein PV325_008611 [Microctonus aethiopoides]
MEYFCIANVNEPLRVRQRPKGKEEYDRQRCGDRSNAELVLIYRIRAVDTRNIIHERRRYGDKLAENSPVPHVRLGHNLDLRKSL